MTHYDLRRQQHCGTNGFIYFIEHQFAFKVGFSKLPEKRLLELQTSNYLPLTLTGCFEASIEDEKSFHTSFKMYSLGNEWYPVSARSIALEYLRNIDAKFYRNPKIKKKPKPKKAPPLPNNEAKAAYIKRYVDVDTLLDLNSLWHKNSPQMLDLIRFGQHHKHKRELGFSVPKSARGNLDPIGYFRKILTILGYTMALFKKTRQDGKRINYYRVIKS